MIKVKMDVDLLRPGTVPLSPDTILWFEFLLDANLLKKHLNKPNPEPSPCELIEEFLRVDNKNGNSKPTSERVVDMDGPPSPPAVNNSTPLCFTRKQLALKILALKVAATLHWNLDIFETNLPPQTQQNLMQDLVYMSTDTAFVVPPQEVCRELVQKPQVQFALTLYHRWILRYPVKAALYAKSSKLPFVHLPGMQADGAYNQVNQSFEKILRMCEANRMQSIRYLDSVLSYYENMTGRKEAKEIKVPVMEAFVHLTEDSDDMEHDWDAGDVYISHYELAMQIHYDLCYNYFFYGQHDLAKQHILECKENSMLLQKDVEQYGYGPHKSVPWGNFNYASVSKDDIFGYIRALNLGHEVLNEEPSLIQKLQESIANHYTGIIAILQADNITREIPMVHREVVELDIQGSASSGAFTVARDLLNRVSALNAVRYALEGGIPSTHPDFINRLKTFGVKFFDLLFWAIAPVLTLDLSEEDWKNLKMFFLHLGTSQFKIPIDKIDEYLKKYVGESCDVIRRKLISDKELKIILNDQASSDDENMDLPRELLSDDWETPDFELKSVPELDMGRLKKRLIEASTADNVRMCLVKLAMTSPSAPLWKLSPTWKPPGELGNAFMSLPRSFLQDFGYIVSGASRARAEAGCSRAALSLLLVVSGEARSQLQLTGGADHTLYALCRLLAWEVLLLQVNVMLSEWPHHGINLTALANKCKSCLEDLKSSEMIPRPQVVEACWACLVNACEWENLGVANGPGEASAALCAACYELQRGKATRKFPRALWDYALSVYNNGSNGPVKRTAGGMPSHSRDAPNAAAEARNAFNSFLATLREPLAINVVLSLLARIHNLLVDDNSLEIVVEYTSLWPSNISNTNNYNVKHVLESLTEVLERSLKLYPYNTSWLRVYGDVEMSSGRWSAALRRYLCALAGSSWHFAKRAPDEPAIARRAARCCQALHAPTQAAALSQLADEPDYATAFKCIAEKNGNTADAMDGYYGCFWDGTLLEVAVALHARRGEGGRRARAVTAAGALELNANNSEDIQREAAAVRRARLLRALTAQYVS